MTDTQQKSEWGNSEFREYCAEGEKRAFELGNRGPIRFTPEGRLHPEILDAYERWGFYVFVDVIGEDELQECRSEVDALLERAPWPHRESEVDRNGRPALGPEFAINPWIMTKPLSDPVGGTSQNNGRHPVKMFEPEPGADSPVHVPYLVSGCLQLLPSFLRISGHPDILRVAETINGTDFTPFTEVLFVKEPEIGPSVSWHQDGQIHWDSPHWDSNIHGYNVQVQLYGSTPANGVWVIPGTHREGKVDIAARVSENNGSDWFADAVPLVCQPGDAFITNRQTVHGSFPNTSKDRRITVNFGFHRYSSVIGQTGKLSGDGNLYTEEYVRQRCRTIPLAIDARSQRFPDEERYIYQPFVGQEDEHRYGPETIRDILNDYNLQDLGI
ncbi:MAG: phytanoyl-CoA dioxygenase family protein [Candidatus Poriferisodalaceae bacterium]